MVTRVTYLAIERSAGKMAEEVVLGTELILVFGEPISIGMAVVS